MTAPGDRVASKAKPRILIVDDDMELQRLLVRYLADQGYDAEAVGDGQAMDRWLSRKQADLLILDLMLPGEDGLSLARRLRQQQSLPIIMLSARGEEMDRIIGLEVGADDYLAKPFNPRELLARIRAVLRRSLDREGAVASRVAREEPAASSISFGEFVLDPDTRRLWRDGEELELTSGEMSLLVALATRPNRVLSRDQLMDLVGGQDGESYDRSIDVRITRLRRKLGEGHPPRFIRTVWGQGYRFTPDPKGSDRA